MATKKKTTETARLQIICTNKNECDVIIDGDPQHLIAAFASLMANDDEDNSFRQMMATAISVVLFKDQMDIAAKKKKKTVKKKAAPKKKK